MVVDWALLVGCLMNKARSGARKANGGTKFSFAATAIAKKHRVTPSTFTMATREARRPVRRLLSALPVKSVKRAEMNGDMVNRSGN